MALKRRRSSYQDPCRSTAKPHEQFALWLDTMEDYPKPHHQSYPASPLLLQATPVTNAYLAVRLWTSPPLQRQRTQRSPPPGKSVQGHAPTSLQKPAPGTTCLPITPRTHIATFARNQKYNANKPEDSIIQTATYPLSLGILAWQTTLSATRKDRKDFMARNTDWRGSTLLQSGLEPMRW